LTYENWLTDTDLTKKIRPRFLMFDPTLLTSKKITAAKNSPSAEIIFFQG
jgi:hypothetical protein